MKFDVNETQKKPENFGLPKILVLGLGGAGSNAANHAYQKKIENIDVCIANTDSVHLNSIDIPNKINLGYDGLGAGADIEEGKAALLGKEEEIKELLKPYHLIFITAGFGGGTGTGAAPEVAKIAKEMGILTVAVVTIPFNLERREKNARIGLERIEKEVDSLITIPNQKIYEIAGQLTVLEAFQYIDDVLIDAINGIVDLVTKSSYMNCDFKDLKNALQVRDNDNCRSIIGMASAKGDDVLYEALENACNHPLLQDYHLPNAQGFVVKITASKEIRMHTLEQLDTYISDNLAIEVSPFLAMGINTDLDEDEIKVTVIATGLEVGRTESRLHIHNRGQSDTNNKHFDNFKNPSAVNNRQRNHISNNEYQKPNLKLQHEVAINNQAIKRQQPDFNSSKSPVEQIQNRFRNKKKIQTPTDTRNFIVEDREPAPKTIIAKIKWTNKLAKQP